MKNKDPSLKREIGDSRPTWRICSALPLTLKLKTGPFFFSELKKKEKFFNLSSCVLACRWAWCSCKRVCVRVCEFVCISERVREREREVSERASEREREGVTKRCDRKRGGVWERRRYIEVWQEGVCESVCKSERGNRKSERECVCVRERRPYIEVWQAKKRRPLLAPCLKTLLSTAGRCPIRQNTCQSVVYKMKFYDYEALRNSNVMGKSRGNNQSILKKLASSVFYGKWPQCDSSDWEHSR